MIGDIFEFVGFLIACWVLYDGYRTGLDKVVGPWRQLKPMSRKMHPISWFFFTLILWPVSLPFYVCARARFLRGDLA